MPKEEAPQQECIYCMADMNGTSIFDKTCPHSFVRERDHMRRNGLPQHFPMPWVRK